MADFSCPKKWWFWSLFTHVPRADRAHTSQYWSAIRLNNSVKYGPDRPTGSVWKVTKTTIFFDNNFWDCFLPQITKKKIDFYQNPTKSSKNGLVDTSRLKMADFSCQKMEVLVTFHTVPVGRSGPYFTLLFNFIAEQYCKVWARSAHGKCVKSDQNHQFFGPNFWDYFFQILENQAKS